ncbi:hypothetical protein J6590_054110 [Homalodisca vitripennis]|nr:hypothetical protein J6590_054110 [Homalodisca vitripennis]
MSPITQKQTFKNLNIEKKQEKKKWKEQKLLKAAAEFKKELEEDVSTNDNTKVEDVSSPYEDRVNGNLTHRICPPYTISIAVPGSILDNAQTSELRTYLAGQVARAASIYCVDEEGEQNTLVTSNS